MYFRIVAVYTRWCCLFDCWFGLFCLWLQYIINPPFSMLSYSWWVCHDKKKTNKEHSLYSLYDYYYYMVWEEYECFICCFVRCWIFPLFFNLCFVYFYCCWKTVMPNKSKQKKCEQYTKELKHFFLEKKTYNF